MIPRPGLRRPSTARRVLLLAAQFVLAAGGLLGTALPHPVPVAAAWMPGGAAVEPVLAAGAGGGCTLTAGAGGGILSACPDAEAYADFAASLQVAFESARGAASTSRLTVASSSPGATVLVNGLQAGLTPLDVTLPAGSYLVRVAKDGFVPVTRTVTISADAPGAVSATLEPTGGAQGSFEWVRAQTLIALAGGFPNGSFEIADFIRDKAGAYYVTFSNLASVEFPVDAPDSAPGYIQFNTRPRILQKVIGIAKSTDKGRSWTLVKAWKDAYSHRTWTSPKFNDNAWEPKATGLTDPKEHWIRAFYRESTSETWNLGTMYPLKDGGIAVQLNHGISHVKQGLEALWDNIGVQSAPQRYMGTPLIENLTSGPYRSAATGFAQSKYGIKAEDLATYNAESTVTDVVYNLGTGAETPLSISGGPDPLTRARPTFQGSFNGTDYWLAAGTWKTGEPVNSKAHVYVSKDGGVTLTYERTYDLGSGEVSGFGQNQELRIGPDGTLYVLNQAKGTVWILESGGARLLGTAPADRNAGVYGGNNVPFLAGDFDSAGNFIGAYRSGPSQNDNSRINLYAQVFPRVAVKAAPVAVMTQPNCPACDGLKAFLQSAGVPFQENPADLPASVASSAAAQAASAGYPVLIRLGDDPAAKGAADPVAASRLLGLSKPALVATYQPRVSNMGNQNGTSGSLTLMPQWVAVIVENDQPRILVDQREGVVAFSAAGGAWTSSPVLSTPPSVADEQRVIYSKRYPRFPGGAGALASSTVREVPFNEFAKVSEFVYLYNSAATSVPDGFGGVTTQYDFTLWTTQAAETTSAAYRAIAQASQLIPAAEFNIGLGPRGSAGPLKGELAAYVTAQGTVSEGADRFQRIAVDLRKQGETAVDGNIVARAITGSITVTTTSAGGAPETRDISVILFVDNSRLRLAAPGANGNSRDISGEAVHFLGSNDRWVVTNNLGIPNAVACGQKTLTIPAHSSATFKAADVALPGGGSCLAAMEVAPTQLAGCETWADAQLVLSAQAIDALAQSLVLDQTEGRTNWELAFGARSASVLRVVGLDHLRDVPTCASEVNDATAAVVSVTGTILGGDEAFQPAVKVVDSGRDAITTAPTSQPGSLAWEREWLEFEATYLELTLRTGIADEALAKVMFLTTAGKKLGYQRQLLAVRALLHCNYAGTGLAPVLRLVARDEANADAVRGVSACLQDFALHPTAHWQGYDRALWSGGQFEAGFLGTVINTTLAANPTVAFLVEAARGAPQDYGEFVLARASTLEARAASDPIYRDQATDFALDHYGRIMTAAARDLRGTRGAITRAVLVASPLERKAVQAVLACARSFGVDNPFQKLVTLTTSRSYTAGIPCVDRAADGQGRIDQYRLVALGMRSGLFSALFEQAGRDLDLLYAGLDMTVSAIGDVEAAEGRASAAYSPTLSALDRLMVVRHKAEAVVAARGHQISVREAAQVLSGVVECGIGLVKSVFSGEGILLLGLGVGATVAGPTAAAVGGLAFLVSGVAFTGLAATSLAQAWEGLDLTAKTAGLCGAAASALFTFTAAAGLPRLARGWTPAQLKLTPPKVISLRALLNRGRGQAMPLEEQAGTLSRRGGGVADVVDPALPPDQALAALVDALPAARRGIIRDLAGAMEYGRLEPEARAAFDALARAYGEPGGVAAVEALRKRTLEGFSPADATLKAKVVDAWYRTGGAVLAELLPGRPKSLQFSVGPTGLAGADAELVLAALGDGAFLSVEAAAPRGTATPALQVGTSLVQAVLRSGRLKAAIEGPAGGSLVSAEEAAWLSAGQRTALPGPAGTPDLLASLTRPELVATIREGLANGQAQAGVPAGTRLTALTGEYIAAGVFKSAFRLRATFEGRTEPVDVAVKKGIITNAEFALLGELAGKGLTQKPLVARLLERFDGQEALSVEEWVPGDTVRRLFGKPGLVEGVAAFDARLYLRTVGGNGTAARAMYNKDLHWENLKGYPENGGLRVKAIDFDPAFTREVTPEQYWAANMVRRTQALGLAVTGDLGAYLNAALSALEADGGAGGRAGALALFRRVREALADPARQADVLSAQAPKDIPAAASSVVRQLDAWLVGK